MKSIAFIDAGTLRPTIAQQRLKLESHQRLDWQKLMQWLRESQAGRNCMLADSHYYDAIPDITNPKLEKFHTFLRHELGLRLHFCRLRTKIRECPHCGEATTTEEQKGVDVTMALHMVKLARYFDEAVILSGDGDFESPVSTLRNDFGRQVTVIGWRGGISPTLRAASNRVIHLEDHASHFVREIEPRDPTVV